MHEGLVLTMAHFLSSANTKGQSEKDADCFMVGKKHRDINIYYRYQFFLTIFCPRFDQHRVNFSL